jgi:ELWxxDGT repeat protein
MTQKVLFNADDGTHGYELWVTDGTAAGTSLVDINPVAGDSSPGDITALGNGEALFDANDGTHGFELWVTDGTSAGTSLVTDINPGSGGSYPYAISALGNGKALFSANDGTYGYELWVTDGTQAGTYLVKDINAGSANSYPSSFAALCFAPGTRISTPGGEVAVETLRRGDLVLVTDGGARPVTWIGRQTISTRFGDPLRVLPIRIRAGALAQNVPCRDLLLTPDHALLVDDVLVQAGALVNGVSIVRERNVPARFTYYHVELDDHSLLLAENTPAETFVDNVDRLAFDNWAEHEALYPEGKPIVEMPYPRAKAYRQVPRRIKLELEARCAELYEAVREVA